MKRIRILLLLLVAGSHTMLAQEMTGYDIIWGVRAPMRDGVLLNATVYKPHGQKDGLPVIIDLTPYVADTYHARGRYFSQHGYVYAIVDCRGRGSSEGDFFPFLQEAKDGYDLVEWFAKQPYCNGKVTTWGGSYTGHSQWATAKEFPPHLMTIVPVAAAHPGIDYPNPKNIFLPYVISHLTYISGKTPNLNLFNDGDFWKAKYLQLYSDHLPFNELDKIAGNETTKFQTFLQHPSYDDFWKSMNPSADDFKKMTLPVLTITGHYDDDQMGNMSHYNNFMRNASAAAKANMYLVIGPWDHAGTRTPLRELGGLVFGPEGVVNMNNLHRQWYDYTMKNGPKPELLKKNVAYYVMGAERWKYADRLQDIEVRPVNYFLSSNGPVHDTFHSGTLGASVADKSQVDVLIHDPLSIQTGTKASKVQSDRTFLKTNLLRSLAPPPDVMSEGDEIAVYHSEAFRDTTEVSGFVKLKLYISADVPDADLSATLYEITSAGESIYLTSDLMRLRYRESLEYEKLMKPDEVYECNFSAFNFFSRQMNPGSRLRLVVAVVNSVSWQKNYGSGGEVAKETAADARKGKITLYHDKRYPSSLLVPLSK